MELLLFFTLTRVHLLLFTLTRVHLLLFTITRVHRLPVETGCEVIRKEPLFQICLSPARLSPNHKAIYSKNTSIYILRLGLPCQKYLSLPSALAVRLTDIRMDHPFSPSAWRKSVSALRLCVPPLRHPSSFSGTSVYGISLAT